MIRVLHVDTAREWRGGQTQLLHLLSARPADEVVLCPDAPLRPAVEALGNRVHLVAFRGPLRGTRRLARVVRDRSPELLAAHTSHAHAHAVRLPGVPVVVHRRLDFAPSRLSRRKYRAPLGYVAVSHAVRRVLQGVGVPSERIVVVHDGVDAAAHAGAVPAPDLAPAHGDPPLIGAVGALVPHKGHAVLVRALELLRERGVAVRAVVAGDGPLRTGLRARGGSVRWLGRRGDVPAVLAALDLFVHPSIEEGMGQAVVEAMAAGVPVVATAAGGVPEVVLDGVTGRLARPGDPQDLAATVQAALDQPLRTRCMARRAAARARDRFGVDRMVRETAGAWGRLVGLGTGSARRARLGG